MPALHENDRRRGDGACYHLMRAVQLRQALARPECRRSAWRRRRYLEAAADHLRIARGQLGAIGFEHGWRLRRRDA